VLRQLDDADGSMISAAAAQRVFSQLGEQRGLAAVQRIALGSMSNLSATR
jgi:hypothetical protein